MAKVNNQQCPDCPHTYAEHDIYGCSHWPCECLRIDRHSRFDKGNSRAIPAPVE